MLVVLSCSKDTEINYLTSVERAKEGIVGTWKNVENNKIITFNGDGTAHGQFFNTTDNLSWSLTYDGEYYVVTFIKEGAYFPTPTLKISKLNSEKLTYLNCVMACIDEYKRL